MFRKVKLPDGVSGRLFLHHMPGRYEAFSRTAYWIQRYAISRVVCLAPLDEIRYRSRDYVGAIDTNRLSWKWECFPITNREAPEDREGFRKLAHDIAGHLQDGENVLIHCGAGVARTGTLAICVLISLGLDADRASTLVANAGARPEGQSQRDVIAWMSDASRNDYAVYPPLQLAATSGPSAALRDLGGAESC